MIGPINWIDLLFLVTIVLLIFNGFRNGAVFSLINLLSIPIAIGVAYFLASHSRCFLQTMACYSRLSFHTWCCSLSQFW